MLKSDAEIEIDRIRARLAAHPRSTDLAARRARVDALGAAYVLPDHIVIESVDANGVPAEWTSSLEADRDRVILFLHGGGYVSGSLASHRHTVAQIGQEAGMRTLALAYRLAPENPFPAALDDALAGYQYLLDQGIASAHIALGGESAGGGLALATVQMLRREGLPLPGCLWLSSPWTDLALTGASLGTKAAIDPLISRAYLAELAGAYLDGVDPLNPLVSPIYADLSGPAANVDPGWLRRDTPRRCMAACWPRRRSRRGSVPAGLATHDPCVASVLSRGRRWSSFFGERGAVHQRSTICTITNRFNR